MVIELERTFLIKKIPEGLKDCKHKEIIDIYIPKSDPHPKIRIRKNGDNYEITKKQPISKDDFSQHEEQTIELTKEEFESLNKLEGKRVHKQRYYYKYKGHTAEIDVFQEPLKGLIVADFEFDSVEEKDSFEKPDFCSADITHEEFIAGGKICGKKYEDIEEELERYRYEKLFLE